MINYMDDVNTGSIGYARELNFKKMVLEDKR